MTNVHQGWISSVEPNNTYSEAITLNYDPSVIPLSTLLHIHLLTHSATSDHSMRSKYRSAVYYSSDRQLSEMTTVLQDLQQEFNKQLITQVLPLVEFRENVEQYQSYYSKHKGNGFCNRYIEPKFDIVKTQYEAYFRE